MDAVMVVSAPAFLQAQRVMARPGMTAAKLIGVLRQQMPDAAKRKLADVVVPTGLGLAVTRRALARTVRRLGRGRGRFWPPNPWRERWSAELARMRKKAG
jgi:dephospho-CoA kinase